MSCLASFDRLCRKIVAPTRHEIDDEQMIDRKFRGISPPHQLLKIQNSRNQNLSTLIFHKDSAYPTILYLHGNGGNKLQIVHIVKMAEKYPFNFAAFDFSGCGKSEGEFITYGEEQVEDIHTVMSFLMNKHGIKTLFLWGRSMGASLGLLYGSKYPGYAKGMILDSPFRSLEKIIFNVATSTQSLIPNFLISIGVFFVKCKVENLVDEQIFDVDYSLAYQQINPQRIPLLFAFSTRDSVVKEEDVREMYELYTGPKKLSQFSCLHPEDRPKNFIYEALDYLIATGSKGFQQRGIGVQGFFSTSESFKHKNGSMSTNPRNKWNN